MNWREKEEEEKEEEKVSECETGKKMNEVKCKRNFCCIYVFMYVMILANAK